MSKSPYIPFYTSDFLGGTSGMTASTKGVYITLLCLMYESDGPLPQKWDTLARRAGCTVPAFRKAVQSLEDDGKIAITEDGLWSRTVEKHIALRRERGSSARSAANIRWQKTQRNQGESDATASVPQCQPEPEPEPLIKEEGKPSSKKHRGSRLDDDWELPSDWGKWAVAEGMDEIAVRREADRFRDWWKSAPGAKGVKLDWQATWRNWIRKAMDDRRSRGVAAPKPGHVASGAFGNIREIC